VRPRTKCRHADLAWAVHAWAQSRLTADERGRVDRAMDDVWRVAA
jgi:hypothetical protein